MPSLHHCQHVVEGCPLTGQPLEGFDLDALFANEQSRGCSDVVVDDGTNCEDLS